MLKLPVHRIIPFSNVEGIGNRTSVFVQGCNVNCLYCHNSETIPLKHKDAKEYTVAELLEQIKYNTPFIRGVTVSGGEATLYPQFITELFKQVRPLGLTCYIDTNGFFDKNQAPIAELIDVTDKFLYDVKGVGEPLRQLCFSSFMVDGGNRDRNHEVSGRFVEANQHIANLQHLLTLGKVEEVRLVYLKGFYDEDAVLSTIAKTLVDYPHVPLKVIRMHSRGLPKGRVANLKGSIPSTKEVRALVDLARAKSIKNVEYIL